jgi:hypothetical protein
MPRLNIGGSRWKCDSLLIHNTFVAKNLNCDGFSTSSEFFRSLRSHQKNNLSWSAKGYLTMLFSFLEGWYVFAYTRKKT